MTILHRGEALSSLLLTAAKTRPGATAVREGGVTTTYAELAAIAGAAQALVEDAGVGPGDRVAVLAPQTARSVAALHAVLAAGAAYVPLDPASPPARWRSVCEMSGTSVVAGQGAPLAALSREMPDVRVIDLDRVEPGTAPAPVPRAAHDLGAVLPTSGSTGTPKGVALSREALETFALWMNEEFRVGPDDVVAGFSPLHFDISVFTVFGTAAAGATLAPVPAGRAGLPGELVSWAGGEGVTVWYSAPYLLSGVSGLEAGTLESHLGRVRSVCFAGEVFPHEALAALMRKMPWAHYANLYGPTETNVCTFERITVPPEAPVPIGGGSRGADCWVERDGERVEAVGATGELVVAGPTVAHGYWGNAEETARRFRFAKDLRAGRAYATGDQVQILPGGRYAFLGRRDHMVKIRGRRLELEEVEAVVRGSENVTGCCAVAIDLPGRATVLGAAVSGEGLDHGALRSHCRSRLPSWAVPQRFVELPALPLTSSGKTDRTRVHELVADAIG